MISYLHCQLLEIRLIYSKLNHTLKKNNELKEPKKLLKTKKKVTVLCWFITASNTCHYITCSQ